LLIIVIKILYEVRAALAVAPRTLSNLLNVERKAILILAGTEKH